MNNIILIIKHLYKTSVVRLQHDEVKLFISVYYHTVSVFGYSKTKTMFNSFDKNWENKYFQYIQGGHYSFTSEELYTEFLSALENDAKTISAKIIRLFECNKNNFFDTLSKSDMNQDKITNRRAALYQRTTEKNYSQHH